MDPIDRFSDRPACVQVADQLRQMILSGETGPDRPLPSKAAVRAELGVSGLTYDHAIRLLKDEGLVRTARGIGHFPVPEGERPQR